MQTIKNTILILAMLFCGCAKLNAQTIKYDTCNNLQQFEGEWQYTTGQDTVRIYLRAARTLSSSSNHLADVLYGWHEYKKGNVIVESNYQNRFLPIPYDSDSSTNDFSSIYLQPYRNNLSSNKLIGYLWDYTEIDEYHTVTALLSNNNTIMSWKLMHREGYGFPGGHKGMTLPKTFVLIKH